MTENWTVEYEEGFANYEAEQEYAEWSKMVDESTPPEEPEVDAWGLPCRSDADFSKENWNPSDAEVTKYWEQFWERVMEV